MDTLSTLANIATILTAAVAISAAVYFWQQRRKRRVRLESYLVKSKEAEHVFARRIPHLMAECLMTEGQLFEAALASSKVNVWNAIDEEQEETDTVLFSFDPKGRARKQRSN